MDLARRDAEFARLALAARRQVENSSVSGLGPFFSLPENEFIFSAGVIMAALFIKWTETNKTGINIIDEQHRAILSIINSFFFFRDDTDIERILAPTAEALKSYAKIHFRTEETLMRLSGYPGLEEHIALHEKIRHDLWLTERRSRKIRDAIGFLHFLKNYWLEHVNGADQNYSEHLRKFFGKRV